MGMCALYEGCAIMAGSWLLTQNLADCNRPFRRSQIELFVPSIAHAIISLCFRVDWHS
jgi:hypothetical protein